MIVSKGAPRIGNLSRISFLLLKNHYPLSCVLVLKLLIELQQAVDFCPVALASVFHIPTNLSRMHRFFPDYANSKESLRKFAPMLALENERGLLQDLFTMDVFIKYGLNADS